MRPARMRGARACFQRRNTTGKRRARSSNRMGTRSRGERGGCSPPRTPNLSRASRAILSWCSWCSWCFVLPLCGSAPPREPFGPTFKVLSRNGPAPANREAPSAPPVKRLDEPCSPDSGAASQAGHLPRASRRGGSRRLSLHNPSVDPLRTGTRWAADDQTIPLSRFSASLLFSLRQGRCLWFLPRRRRGRGTAERGGGGDPHARPPSAPPVKRLDEPCSPDSGAALQAGHLPCAKRGGGSRRLHDPAADPLRAGIPRGGGRNSP